MSPRPLLLPLVTLGALLGALGAAPGAALPRRLEIRMRAISYAPGELRAAVGDTIVWRNVDLVRHNAVREGLFDTGELQPGDSATWVAADTGTLTYRCTIHPRMRGRLVIAPE